MRVAVVALVAGITAVGVLVIRRILRIRDARSQLHRLAHRTGLDVLPSGYFRVCISGTSSGIGKACAEYLSQFSSVSVHSIGRSSVNDSFVDLTEANSIRECLNKVERLWYKSSENPSSGLDIWINNAGLFSSKTPSKVWWPNALAPAFMAEDMSYRFVANHIKSRMLRFVQVSSRLETKSDLDKENMRGIIASALDESIHFTSTKHYADSKRAMIYHTAYMHQKYASSHPSLSYVAVTPGMVNTSLGKSVANVVLWVLSYPLRFLFLRSPIEGVLPIMYAAFGCPSESGVYTADQEIIERISTTRDSEAGEVFSQIMRERFNSI